MKKNYIKAEELDIKFDKGQDIIRYFDIAKSERHGLKQEKVIIAFPTWMLKSINKEAEKLGVSKEFIIKQWISEKIKQSAA